LSMAGDVAAGGASGAESTNAAPSGLIWASASVMFSMIPY